MGIHCWLRGTPKVAARPKDKSQAGNPVSKFGDKDNMEYKPVKRDPGWDGSSAVVAEGK